MFKRLLLSCGLLLAVVSGSAMSVVEHHDTICWQQYYDFMGTRYELPDYWSYRNVAFMEVTLEYFNEQDSVNHKMLLAVVPVESGGERVVSDTIKAGDSYDFYGDILSEEGEYTKTVTGACNCVGTYILHLEVLTTDTVYDAVNVCENDLPYEWHGKSLERAGEHVHRKQYKGWDVDSVVYILDMNVLEVAYTYKDTTMYQGEKYVWQGRRYTDEGVYKDTLQRVNGCDSILTLTLTVLKNEVTVHEIETSGQCADHGAVIISMDVTGLVDSLYITFSSADKALGLRDSAMVMPTNNTVRMHYQNMRAGKYEAVLRGVFRSMEVFEERVELSFFYPSFVLEQRWNDVIAVLTHDYNGGYDFTAFQWYKNGQALAGETRHYLHQELEAGAEYSALLTDRSGMQLMSCPLVAEEREDISLYPTVVQDAQRVCCRVYERAKVYIYDATGVMISQIEVPVGDSYLHLPSVVGVYMVKVITESNQERGVKIVVL